MVIGVAVAKAVAAIVVLIKDGGSVAHLDHRSRGLGEGYELERERGIYIMILERQSDLHGQDARKERGQEDSSPNANQRRDGDKRKA